MSADGNNNLREIREKRGLTLKTLSEKSGLQIRAIQKIERGEVNIENITAKNLLALSEALKVAPQSLFK